MKRQTQAIGVRDWYGWDFLSLQEEPLKVVDGFFSQYGAFVLCGCEVTDNGSKFNVAPGLVVLEGQGAEGGIVKIVVPFAGLTATTLPLYLTLGYETETDVYHDGKVKPIVNIYKAVATTVKPAGSHVVIAYDGTPRFTDVIQDSGHRFINDAERNAWNTVGNSVFRYDYIVDSDQKLAGVRNNPSAINVLVKSGEWTYNSPDYCGITLHANTRRIIGEPGAVIRIYNEGADLSLGYATRPNAEDGYCIENITVISMLGKNGACFQNMVNMTNCTGKHQSTGNICQAFKGCFNLKQCIGSVGLNYKEVFADCENMFQCKDVSTVSSYTIMGCKYVFQCEGNIFNSGTNVSYCKAKQYGDFCFFSSANNTTHRAADTLNGGWNRILA